MIAVVRISRLKLMEMKGLIKRTQITRGSKVHIDKGEAEVNRHKGDVTDLVNGKDIDHHAEMTRVIINIHLIGNKAEGMAEIAKSINTPAIEGDLPHILILPKATEIEDADQEVLLPETITEVNTLDNKEITAESPENMTNAATTRKGIPHQGVRTKRETVVHPKKFTPTSKNAKEELIKTGMKSTGMASSGSRRPRP